MYDSFFDMAVVLSERFPSLNPIKVRKSPAHEVFLLFKRLRAHDKRHRKDEKAPNKGGVIRKKAGDNWF